MKIPREIETALRRRVKAAIELNSADFVISKFIRENDIEAEECDYCTGVEMYSNPYESADRIREAIKAKTN